MRETGHGSSVHYGPPAAGKLTVARELAALTGYKLVHNHLSIELVNAVFEFGSEQSIRLNGSFRLQMFEAAARAGIDGVIFTFVYAARADEPFIEQTVTAVTGNGGRVCFVQLACSPAELERRVVLESRKAFGKISRIEQLQRLMAQMSLFQAIPGHESLRIDTEEVSPAEAARMIAEHYALPVAPSKS